MDGGGKTPRGRKPRGGRGRGSPRTPTSVTASQSPVQQSSGSSSTASSTLSTPPISGKGRDEQQKADRPKKVESSPTPVVTITSEMSSTPVKDQTVPATAAKEENIPKNPMENQKEESKETPSPSSRTEKEKKDESADEDDLTLTMHSITTPTSTDSYTDYKTPSRGLATPEPPPEIPEEPKTPSSTEKSKIADLLTQKPITTAKTLVVTPPRDVEKSTDNPIVVDIDPNILSTPSGECGSGPATRPSSSASQTQPRHSRSGSASPAYAYSLRGPVGKPGYIGGVGFSDEETPSRKNSAMLRRESAIAAVETAVKGFSKRQWILLFMFGLIDLLSAVTISLQAPFFPAEAEKKGATATEYGFVFGIFEFIVFLMSPFYGKYMNKLGPKTVFSVCIYITSAAVICFGLLDRIDDHTTFVALCFVCRIFEALGCAGFFTSTFVIIACEFPESVATTFASLETFFGLGMILGPLLGGFLYQFGGFSLPFYVVGAALGCTALIASLIMPKIDKVTDEDGTEQSGYGVWTILKIPSIFLACCSLVSTSMSLGFVSATLEPHLRGFGLTPLQTGLIFIVNGGMYALSAPCWGYICDYIRRPVYITILGNIFIVVSFLLIGPIAFMPFDTILWVTIIGLVIQGLGFGCCLVSGFIIGLRDSMKHGLPDNMATYGVASGLWTSCISLGAFIGPVTGGVLYDNVGFRTGSYLVLASALIVGITNFIYTCCTTGEVVLDPDSEYQALLRPVSPLTKKKDVESPTPEPSTSTYGSA